MTGTPRLRPRNLPRASGGVMGPPRKHEETEEQKRRREATGLGRLRNSLPALNAEHSFKKKGA